MPSSPWITTRTAHQRSGIPRRTIIAAINRGELPAQKLPGLTGSFLIDPADFQSWARNHPTRRTTTSTPDRPLEQPTPSGLADSGARAEYPPGAGPVSEPPTRAIPVATSAARAGSP